jgi:hypothetical protein
MRPLSHEEVAQSWVGLSESELYALRIELAADGTGRGAYVFADNPAHGFEIKSWKYDPKKMIMSASLVDRSEDDSRSLDGTVVGTAMEVTMRGEGWKQRFSLRPERTLQQRWEKLKDAMPESGH